MELNTYCFQKFENKMTESLKTHFHILNAAKLTLSENLRHSVSHI